MLTMMIMTIMKMPMMILSNDGNHVADVHDDDQDEDHDDAHDNDKDDHDDTR